MELRLPTLERPSVELCSPTEVSRVEPIQPVRRAVKRFQSPIEVSRVEPVQLVRPAVKRYQSPAKDSRVEPGRVTLIWIRFD